IGRWSFADVNSYDDVKNSKRTDGNYTISNCAHLKSIEMGDVAFGDYRIFSLANLPSLESIVMGAYSFYHAPFALQNLPSLRSIAFGDYAFNNAPSVVVMR
ncbi:hypothetical protein WA538_002183, partial [Blastocystis sp. DL]